MNIKQFKEWLDQFDDDTIVQVLIKEPALLYESFGDAQPWEFTGNEYGDYEYTDFSGNPFVEETAPYYEKKFLCLGGEQ